MKCREEKKTQNNRHIIEREGIAVLTKSDIKNYMENHALLRDPFRKLLNLKKTVNYLLHYKYKYEVNNKVILFESYHGEGYNCNPRGIYEALLKNEQYWDYTFVWAFKNPEQYEYLKSSFRTVVVRSGSKKYYRYCASAKFIIINMLLRPRISLKKEQIYIETWHGKPIKRIGRERIFETDPRRSLEDTKKHYLAAGKKITKLLSPSPYFSPIMGKAFGFDLLDKNESIIETGYPRNDALFHYTTDDVVCIKERLGLDPLKRTILYAPTWRELFSAYIQKENPGVVLKVSESIDFARLKQQLGDKYQILFRAHHMDAAEIDLQGNQDFVIDVTDYENVNDLYIVSDLMVSDYSGTIFDFSLLRRPMVFYLFDRELYTTKLQGVNIDLNELPGVIVEKEADLAPAIKKQFDTFRCDRKYEEFINKYSPYDDGGSGQRVINKCMVDTYPSKTLTVQTVKKHFDKRLRPILYFSKCLKWNGIGILREIGFIHDSNTQRLRELKNKYQGKRCFLIGNGPSLNAKDLDMIIDEISFGCNFVYKMFAETKWRPTFHFMVDVAYTKNLYNEIAENIQSPMITHDAAYRSMKIRPDDLIVVKSLPTETYNIRGNMMAYYVPAKATVMTFMIEMAMYMGFSEIYLLGVDCTNSFAPGGHFGKEYTPSDLDKANLARARKVIGDPNLTLEGLGEYRLSRSIKAYQTIAEYAQKKNVKIFNATRGGALEAFPRINLEDVIG